MVVVCPTKERIAQYKHARAGLLATLIDDSVTILSFGEGYFRRPGRIFDVDLFHYFRFGYLP